MRSLAKVFLTGASAGIGLAITQRLCKTGRCEVWGTSRTLEKLPRDLPNFHPVQLNLNDPKSLDAQFQSAQTEAGGHFDVLINNAGDGWFGPAIDVPRGTFHRQFETLVFSPFHLVQLALPAMREAAENKTNALKRSLIINVSSLAGRLHLPYSAPYNAAKAAMSALTASLRMEEADIGSKVRIVDLQPGDICTNFNRAMKESGALEEAKINSRWPAAIQALQKVLKISDHDVENGPSPDIVARQVEQLIFSNRNPARKSVGMFTQAVLGPLGLRVLPVRWMHYFIRKHFQL